MIIIELLFLYSYNCWPMANFIQMKNCKVMYFHMSVDLMGHKMFDSLMQIDPCLFTVKPQYKSKMHMPS